MEYVSIFVFVFVFMYKSDGKNTRRIEIEIHTKDDDIGGGEKNIVLITFSCESIFSFQPNRLID